MYQILIVDDEERYRRTFKIFLTRNGYRTLTASTVEEAKAILIKEYVDLLLLDINMGNGNVNILFEEAHALHPQIKIIVASVYSLEEQPKIIGGADGYYDKTDSHEVLLKKVKRLIKDV